MIDQHVFRLWQVYMTISAHHTMSYGSTVLHSNLWYLVLTTVFGTYITYHR